MNLLPQLTDPTGSHSQLTDSLEGSTLDSVLAELPRSAEFQGSRFLWITLDKWFKANLQNLLNLLPLKLGAIW